MPRGPNAALAQLLDDADARRKGIKIALDETMRADFALLVLDALPGAAREFTEATIGALRAQKDEAEFKALKENALIDDGAMLAGFAACRPGRYRARCRQGDHRIFRGARGRARCSRWSASAKTAPFRIIIPAGAC